MKGNFCFHPSRLGIALGIVLVLAAPALWGQYRINSGGMTVNGASDYANGIWLGRATLTFTGDAPGVFGSQSTVRNNTKGQIIVGDYTDGAPVSGSYGVNSHIVSTADITVGYRIQLLGLQVDTAYYLGFPLGVDTGGKLLTISGVQNLSNEGFAWSGGVDKVGMYKYGGAIGVYGSTSTSNNIYATGYRTAKSFLDFAGGSKLRLSQNEAQYGGGLGYYKQADPAYGGYYFDFKPLAYLDVSENHARSDGGGMYFFSNESAAYANYHRELVVDLGLHTSFTRNSASGQGGGIYIAHEKRQIELTIQGDTYFRENTAGTKGGAIYADSGQTYGNTNSPTGGFIIFDATSGIIAFSGNTANGQANSVHAERNTFYRIQAIQNVYFNDPISSGASTGSKGNSLTKSGAGILQFAGGDSVLNSGGNGGAVTIEGGTFRVVKNSSFSTAGNGAVFSMSPTTVLAGGGRVGAGNINLNGVTVSPDSAQLSIPVYNLETNTFAAPASFIEAGERTGTLTLSGAVYMNGVTLDIDIQSRTDYDKIVVSGGSLTFAGSNVIRTSSWSPGRFNILTVEGGGTINSISGVTGGGQTGRKSTSPGLSADNKTLYLDMFADNAVLTWAKTGTTGIWDDTEANKGWSYSGGTDSFLTGDYVLFNGAAPEVHILGDYDVYGMEVTGGQYTFSEGTVRGLRTADPLIGEFHKFDALTAAGKTMGKLTVSGGNTTANFTNKMDFVTAEITAGAKVTVNNEFIVTNSLTIDGAGSELIVRGNDQYLAHTPNIAVNDGGALAFNKIQDFDYTGVVSGTNGILRKQGPGAMTLSGASTFTGTTDIAAGSVILTGSVANSGVTMAAETVFDISAAASPVIKGLSGAGRVVLGAKTLTVEGGGGYGGVIEGAGGLTKSGADTLSLSGVNTYTGVTTVRGGTLALANGGSIRSGELVMEGGTFDISAAAAGASSPLVLEKLTGAALNSAAGVISIGTKALQIGNSPTAGEIWTYNGNFTGDRAGLIGINVGPASTLRLGGTNGQLYQGTVNVNTGTLELTTANALGGTINVNSGTTLNLMAANALAGTPDAVTGIYASNARIDLRGDAKLEVGNGLAQSFERLVSSAASTVSLNNAALTLKSGVLEGSVTGLDGLTKAAGSGYAADNTLVIAGNLNADGSGNAGKIGNFTVASGTGGAVEIRDGVKLVTAALNLGDNSMLSLSATEHNIITADSLNIGEHLDAGNKGLGTILNITNYGGQGTYSLIKVTGGGAITGQFAAVYVNGEAQPSMDQLTVRNYFAPVSVTYVTASLDKYVTVNSAGLLWNADGTTAHKDKAHGYFWINEGYVITINEKLENNGYVIGDTNTGDTNRRSIKDEDGKYWDGKTLIKEGGGILILNPAGTDANGYTGDTEIRNGVLRISRQEALSGTAKIVVGAGAVFNLDNYLDGDDTKADRTMQFGKNITGAGELLISGGSEVELTGTGNTYTGATVIAGAALKLRNNAAIASSGEIRLGTGGVFDITGVTTATAIKRLNDRGTEGYQDTGTVRLGAEQAAAKNLEVGNGADAASSFSGVIQGWGRLIKTGNQELRLGGDNTFTGGVDFKGGTLILSRNRALGDASNRLTIEGGEKLVLEGVEIDNRIDLKNKLEIFVDEYQDSSLKNAVSFQGLPPADYLLKKTGAGALTIYGENTYEGNTNLESGTLVITNNQSLGQGRLLVTGESAGYRALRLEKLPAGEDLDVPTGITLQDNTALNIEVGSGRATLSGVIEGNAAINKVGNGELVLTKAEKHTGATQVLAGRLTLTGSGDLAASSGVLLNYGSVLDISTRTGDTVTTTINGLSGSGNIELGEHTLTINTAAADAQFDGIFKSDLAADPARAGGLIKEGSKILSLYGQSGSAANPIGLVTVNAGTLQLEENDALKFSAGVVVEGGAAFIGNGTQTFTYLESKPDATLMLRTATINAGKLEGNDVSTVNLTKAGDGTLTINTNVHTLSKLELQQGKVLVPTGIRLNAREVLVNSGTTMTVTLNAEHAGHNLNGAASVPIIFTETMRIADGATIDVNGFANAIGEDGLGQYLIARSEAPIDGMFEYITFDGKPQAIETQQITIDVFHNGVGANKSFDGREIYVVDRGLVWFNSAANTAHGTFKVDNAITISANLNDRHAISGEIFLRDPADPSGRTALWDGKTLTKRGTGELTLTGLNTYQDTVIEEGTLILTRDATLKNTTGKVWLKPLPAAPPEEPPAVPLEGEDELGNLLEDEPPADETPAFPGVSRPTLVLNYAEDDYFSTAITGDGDVVKKGDGAVLLTGNSDFTGTATIEKGMIALGSDGSFQGSGTLRVEEEGTVAVASLAQIARWRQSAAGVPPDTPEEERAETAELKGISGPGTILLYGDDRVRNILRITGTAAFEGSLVGSGIIEQSGTDNTLTLAKAQGDGFTGTVRVDGKEVVLGVEDAITQGSVTVKAGVLSSAADQRIRDLYLGAEDPANLGTARVDLGGKRLSIAGTLQGNGLITAAELAFIPGGIYAPGNSPGLVRVEGDLSFAPGSIYRIDVTINEEDGSLGDHDLLEVTGRVTLNEPQVDLELPDISKVKHEQTVQIIRTETGGTGKFEEWDYIFFDGDYSYKAWVQDNGDALADPETAGWNEVLLHIQRSKNELTQYAKSKNQQSLVEAIIGSQESNPDLFRDLMLLRNSQAPVIMPLLDSLTGEIYASLPALIEDLDWIFGKNLRNRFRYMGEAEPGKFPIWTDVGGILLNHSGDGNAADTGILGAEMEIGMEFGLGSRGLLGVALRGGYNQVSAAERSSKGDMLGFGGGLYGGFYFPLSAGEIKLGAGAGYGMTVGTVSREISSTIVSETQESEYTAHSIQGLLDAGWEYDISEKIMVEPYVGASVHTVLAQPFTETKRPGTGSDASERGYAPLDGEAQTHWNVASLLGLRSRMSLGKVAAFELGASWRHLFGPVTPEQVVNLPQIRNYPVWGAPLNDNAVDLEVGFEFLLGPARLGLGYTLDVGRSVSHQANLGISFLF
jgi:autotransporter-associated beta strand protein/predicted outer membrane repeat protein